MAQFTELLIEEHYDIIDAGGYPLTRGIQGEEAMRRDWPEDSEAYEAITDDAEYPAVPVEVAQ